MILLDTSRSTVDPWLSAFRPDPRRNAPYLEREVRATRDLLSSLEPGPVAVGIAGFAGGRPASDSKHPQGNSHPAWTEAPLTPDFARVEQVLGEIAAREPDGSTHLAAGIDRGTIELMQLRGAISTPRADASRAMVIFTDGLPTLPHGPGQDVDNLAAAGRALRRAARASIESYVVGLGNRAREIQSLAPEIEATGGELVLVRHPHELTAAIRRVAQRLSRPGSRSSSPR